MGSRLEANSSAVRKRIENHSFQDEEGDEYTSSSFGGFRDYFRRKKIKLQNRDAEMRERGRALALQNQSSPDSKQPKFNPNIFRGVVAHVTGYTQPSLADLHKLIVTHGGGFLQYLNGKTAATHIIASSLTPKKRVEYRRYRIVKPAWVVDSVKAGKLLPWDGYRVISGDGVGAGQKILGRADGGKIVNAKEQTAEKGNWLRRGGGYRDQTDASWYTKQLLGGNGLVNASKDDKSEDDLVAMDDEIDVDAAEVVDGQEVNAAKSGSHNGDEESISNNTGSSDILEEDKAGNRDTEDMTEHSEEDILLPNSSERKDLMDVDEVLHDEYGSFNEVDLQNEAILLERGHSSSPIETPIKSKVDSITSNSRERGDAPDILDNQDQEDINNHSPTLDPPKLLSDYRAQYTGEDPSPVRHFPNGEAAQTAEKHNAIILANPRIRKSTAANPDFLEQYYRESRLHHLSTWKADLKSRMQSRAAEQTLSQQSKSGQRQSSVLAAAKGRRYVLHVDFDSFFAAVSLIKNPELQDKPAVVAHGRGSGSEIASCNYPARAFGIKNGMWMRAAQDLCPDLHILPYDFPAYEKASEAFYSAILGIDGGIVQSVSIDEALVDITVPCVEDGIARMKYLADNQRLSTRGNDPNERERIDAEQAQADDIAHSLRAQIRRNTGCNVSIGIGGNVLLAKVALRKAKPAGQYHLRPENILEYMGGLSLQDLPGVAWSIGGKLEALIRDGKTGQIGSKAGIAKIQPVTISDLRAISLPKLISVLGPKTGTRIYEHARGIDRTPVGSHQQTIRKSVSAEVNWGIRFATQAQADDFVRNLCVEVSKRLTKEGVKGKQVTVKMMRRAQDAPLAPPKHLGHGRCDVFSKSVALGVATRDGEKIGKEALGIMKGFACPPGELRGIGVQVTRLEPLSNIAGGNSVGTMDSDRHDSSQKKLQFIKTEGSKSKRVNQKTNDEASKDRKPVKAPPPHFSLSPLAYLSQQKKTEKQTKDEDPIEDELDKPGLVERLAIEAMNDDENDVNADSPARKPLNTLGTQFLMPTQVDAAVLAELPGDVRAKLSRQSGNVNYDDTANTTSANLDNDFDDRDVLKDNFDTSITTKQHPPVLPTQSQLDPEVLAALPDEVRAEILSEYQIPQQQQQSADHTRLLKTAPRTSPSQSVYLSAHSTPINTPQSATTSHSVPKTPSSSILRQSVQNVGRRFQSSGRSVAARRLEGSPSPSPSPRTKINAGTNVNGNGNGSGSGSGNLMAKGRLQLLPPLVSSLAGGGGNVAAYCGVDSASAARPRSAASNSSIGVASGIGTGSGNGTKVNIKTRGSTRGRPRGRPPGIRAKPRSIPSGSNGSNYHGNSISVASNNSIDHSYYKDHDVSHATLTLTQVNFVPSRRNRVSRNDHSKNRISSGDDDSGETDGNGNGTHDEAAHSNSEKGTNEISPDFLAALPPEIRTEVLRQHQQQQQQRQRGRRVIAQIESRSNNITNNNKNTNPNGHARPKRVIKLPPHPLKPTFSTRHLSEPDDLRAAIKDWYAAFRDEGGPYREDVDALVGYLRRVVGTSVGARAESAEPAERARNNTDHDDVEKANRLGQAVGEGNMAKAMSLVRWLEWVVEEGEAEAEADAEAEAEAEADAGAEAKAKAEMKVGAATHSHEHRSLHRSSGKTKNKDNSNSNSNANAKVNATRKQIYTQTSFSLPSFSSSSSPPTDDASFKSQSQIQSQSHRHNHHRHRHHHHHNHRHNHPEKKESAQRVSSQERQKEQALPPSLPPPPPPPPQEEEEKDQQDLLIPWTTAVARVRRGVEDAIGERFAMV